MTKEGGQVADDLKQLAAEAAGLPAEWADRLNGDTMKALAADAAKLADVLGIKTPEAPEPPESALEHWKALAASDPARFNELTEAGDFDPSKPPPSTTPSMSAREAARAREAWDSREYLRRELGGGSSRDRLRELARRNPDEFNRQMDEGLITPEMMQS